MPTRRIPADEPSRLPVLNSPPSLPPKAASSARVLIPSSLPSTPETERKRQLIHNVPILLQLVQHQYCTEDDLVLALKIATYNDNEYIYCQGQMERDVYFVEEGKVLMTQRRAADKANTNTIAASPSTSARRRRTPMEIAMDIPIYTHVQYDYFGEMALLQKTSRKSHAVASGSVLCMMLHEKEYMTLLAPVHQLLLYRSLLRSHCVLEKHRFFKEWTPSQRQYLLDHCTLQTFEQHAYICLQNQMDTHFYIIAEGEVDIVLEEMENHQKVSTIVAQKSLYQGFGEIGLLDRPRTANVIATTNVLCVVFTRSDYIVAFQLHGAVLDLDNESLLATTLIEEWNLVVNTRNLHLSNPRVANYLITFIKKFKAAYNKKFVGKTLYLDFLRRVHHQPTLRDEFEFIASRITWDSPASSLSIIRSETRRVLSMPPLHRSAAETSFIGRMVESTAFLDKFEVPLSSGVDRYKLARHIARVVAFWNIGKDAFVFRQGKIESRAFVILRGKIQIVNEEKQPMEVIATLGVGDSFGELSLVARLQRSATAMAACDTDLLVFDRNHLNQLAVAVPGIAVRHIMVARAEFLSKVSFLQSGDFSQCIRLAHDVQECVYEPRHVFLTDAVHSRTLYVVKSGEIAVFMKKKVPLLTSPNSQQTSNSNTQQSPNSPVGFQTVLVRVATIGAQEFFGLAISILTSNQPVIGTPNGADTSSQSSIWDLGSTVFMSLTPVCVLELPERGWRRLNPLCLQIIRSVLSQRHEWNEQLVEQQKAYYHLNKPWLLIAKSTSTINETIDPTPSTIIVSARPTTNLSRHLTAKSVRTSEYAKLFAPEKKENESSSDANESRSPLPITKERGWQMGWDNPIISGHVEPVEIPLKSWTRPSDSNKPFIHLIPHRPTSTPGIFSTTGAASPLRSPLPTAPPSSRGHQFLFSMSNLSPEYRAQQQLLRNQQDLLVKQNQARKDQAIMAMWRTTSDQ